jgi:hypothetical protein
MRMRNALWALSVGALLAVPAVAQASSHREAPFVTKNPKVDGTDFYMFNSYDPNDTGMVTLIANYIPLEDAYGGPNYFTMDDQALYEIEIDNNGDCIEDLTFQFQFTNTLSNGGMGIQLMIGPGDGGAKAVSVPLGFIGNPSTATNLNVAESYTASIVTGPRRMGTPMAIKNHNGGGTTFTKPLDNVGTKTFGEAANSDSAYVTYANQYIYSVDIPGCATPGQMFVGQRAEPFAVNLGPTFDLVNAPAAVVTAGGVDYGAVANPLAKKNVATIALDVPATCLQASATATVIGGWTTASVRQARVINPKATYPLPSKEGGAWTEVSRLSNPLVNELVIGLPDKDLWNNSEPKDDGQFATYVTNPTLPALIDAVFGVGLQPIFFPRTDLVAAFLTGVPGVNQLAAADGGVGQTCEYIRLNTGLSTALGKGWATPFASQSRLGAAQCALYGTVNPAAAGCDPSGFPNGRRPIDDVVDLALDVMEGYLLPMGAAPAYAGATPTLFTDGVDQSAVPFLPSFPYMNTPTRGANGNGT